VPIPLAAVRAARLSALSTWDVYITQDLSLSTAFALTRSRRDRHTGLRNNLKLDGRAAHSPRAAFLARRRQASPFSKRAFKVSFRQTRYNGEL